MSKNVRARVYVRPHPCVHEKHGALICDTKYAVDTYDGRGKWMGTGLFRNKAEALKDAKRMRRALR